MFVFIADAQALTDNMDNPEKVRQNVIEVALDYLACGLDPAKCTIFIQSQIPELCELSFYYMDLVTVSRLQRNPTVKTEIQMRTSSHIPVPSFTYPSARRRHHRLKAPGAWGRTRSRCWSRQRMCAASTIYGETLVEARDTAPDNAPACCRHDGKAKMSKSLVMHLHVGHADEVQRDRSMYTDPTTARARPRKIEGNTCSPTWMPSAAPTLRLYLPEYPIGRTEAHYRRGGLAT